MPQAMPLTNMISQKSTKQTTYRTLINSFGNGYEQRTPDGVNTTMDLWQVYYEHLTLTQLATVTTVLDAVGGWDYITWTSFLDTVQKRYKVTSNGYNVTTEGGNVYTIQIELQTVYDV